MNSFRVPEICLICWSISLIFRLRRSSFETSPPAGAGTEPLEVTGVFAGLLLLFHPNTPVVVSSVGNGEDRGLWKSRSCLLLADRTGSSPPGVTGLDPAGTKLSIPFFISLWLETRAGSSVEALWVTSRRRFTSKSVFNPPSCQSTRRESKEEAKASASCAIFFQLDTNACVSKL